MSLECGRMIVTGTTDCRIVPVVGLMLAIAVDLAASATSRASWNPVTGIKDGAETVAEPSNPWDGERLLAFGGTLNFAGSVDLDGELWLQQMSGWPNPIVNIPGTLTMFSPSSQFRVVGGADLNIGNAAASSVEAGAVTLNGGSQVTIGDLTAHDAVVVDNAGTLLQLLGDYSQTAGDFRHLGSATFDVDGSFTKTGSGDFSIGSPNFMIGNPAASSVEAGRIGLTAGQPIILGQVIAHDNVDIRHSGTLLHVLGDYQQDNGDFVLIFDGSFDVDGTFTKTGNGAFNIGTPNFAIGNPAGVPLRLAT